jgi:hypothetical protein
MYTVQQVTNRLLNLAVIYDPIVALSIYLQGSVAFARPTATQLTRASHSTHIIEPIDLRTSYTDRSKDHAAAQFYDDLHTNLHETSETFRPSQ